MRWIFYAVCVGLVAIQLSYSMPASKEEQLASAPVKAPAGEEEKKLLSESASESKEVRVPFVSVKLAEPKAASSGGDNAKAESSHEEKEINEDILDENARSKRLGVYGGASADVSGDGGSGNFLFDIIRNAGDRVGREADIDYHEVAEANHHDPHEYSQDYEGPLSDWDHEDEHEDEHGEDEHEDEHYEDDVHYDDHDHYDDDHYDDHESENSLNDWEHEDELNHELENRGSQGNRGSSQNQRTRNQGSRNQTNRNQASRNQGNRNQTNRNQANRSQGNRNQTNRNQSSQNRNQSNRNQTQANRNRNQSNRNQTQANRNRTQSNRNQTQANRNRTQANRNRTQTNRNQTQANRNRTQANRNRTQTNRNRGNQSQAIRNQLAALGPILRLVAGSGANQEEATHITYGPPKEVEPWDDGYQTGVPGPLTRLFVIANRGVANLVQDLILRLAQTSERLVNFKARLITAII